MTSSAETYQLQGELGLRKIMQQAPVAMAILLGPGFSIYLVNEKQRQLWQKTEDELMGRSLFDVFPEVMHQGFAEKLQNVFSTGAPYKGEEVPVEFYRNGKLDNAWFDFIYEPLKNDLGQVEGIIAISTEVTDKVHARNKLEQKREQLHYMVKLSPQVPWTTNAEGHLDYIDDKIYELTGRYPDELLIYGWQTITHPADRQMLQEEWIKCVASTTPYRVEHRLLMPGGEYRWMRSMAFPRKDENGTVLRWYGSTEDIHEMRETMHLTKVY